MIPRDVRDSLAKEDLPVLYEIRDFVAELISGKEMEKSRPGKASDKRACREILEEKHSNSITYRLERIACGKNCKGCPHGPYWYGYWREGGKTRSRYIGKKLKDIKKE